MKKTFYITTAIAYSSSKPHIGNTYEIVLADSIARYKRMSGYDVYFQTGADEHGYKIQLKAQEKNKDPQLYVDEVTAQIKMIWDIMNTSYNKFVRTTDPLHKKKVAMIFDKLYQQGDIYKGDYEGWYCTPCESFFTELQLDNRNCPDCGNEVKKTSEEAYFFKLQKYVKRLVKHIEDNPDFLVPELRKNEMMKNFLKIGLQDLCVSRSSINWGIPVSFDNKHVIYVWIDALSNYITFLDYNTDSSQGKLYQNYWPADVHLIGKDIFRFHAIYWPIMLMALGEKLPKKIFGHPWLLMEGGKMSKSRGNSLYADDLVALFGVDAIRYYVLSETPFASDGTITYDLIIDRINSDLANSLGNLVYRTVSMGYKYFDGEIKKSNSEEEIDKPLIELALNTPKYVEEAMDDLQVKRALEYIFALIRRSNKYIEESMPWELSKKTENRERLGTVLYNLFESIRFIAVLLQPFIPDTSDKILWQLGVTNKNFETLRTFNGLVEGERVKQSPPLFMRIDKDQKLLEIANNTNV